MKTKPNQKCWGWQSLLLIVALFLIALLSPGKWIVSTASIAVLIFELVNEKFALPPVVRKLNQAMQLLTQPFIISFTIGSLLTITKSLGLFGVIIGPMVLICYVVLIMSYVQQYAMPVRSNILRLLWLIYFFQIAIAPSSYFGISSYTDSWVAALLTTGAIGAVTYTIAIISAMQNWQFGDPVNLVKHHVKTNFGVVSVYAVLVLLFLYSNLVNANGLARLTSYSLWKLLLTSIEAAIGEEFLCRFGILTMLLNFARNLRLRIPIAILGSSFIFGLFHFLNLSRQSLSLTVYQFCFTAISGIFFALLFLYTGHLEIIVVIHFVMDFISYITSGTTSLSGSITMTDYQPVINLAVLMLILLVWMMFGKRHQVMEKNADKLIDA